MFRTLLFYQWKTARWAVLMLAPLCLGLPILVMRFATAIMSDQRYGSDAYDMIGMAQVWAPSFPLLAAVTGAAFGLTAWTWDHSSNHVYALSLPMPRWEYVLLKMAAGALLLAIPIGATMVGAIVATTITSIPEGIQAYPIAFAGRFLMGASLIYAITFALAAGTIKTTVRIFVGVMLVMVFGTLFVGFLKTTMNLEGLQTPLEILSDALLNWPGPFNVFGGSWMLIDV